MKNSLFACLRPRLLTLGLSVLLCSLAANTYAASRWYKVEVLVFKRLGAAEATDEVWRNDVTLQYPQKRRWLHSGAEGKTAYKVLPKSTHRLGGHNYTLRKSEDYKVLFHQAWQQPVTSKKHAASIIISGGERLGEHKELEGSITLSVSRYLHLQTNLWLSSLAGANQSGAEESWPLLPNPASEDRFDQALTNNADIGRIVTLKQKRRMRSKELHYIDHPEMGLLILITPIKSS